MSAYIQHCFSEDDLKLSDKETPSEETKTPTLFNFCSSVTSYQTLPRNMPSHSAQIVNHYPEGYRTMPRNRMVRPGSICSTAGSVFDLALHRNSTAMTAVEKRRSLKDITMWQLYEWQQRQAFSRQSLAQPTGNLLLIKA